MPFFQRLGGLLPFFPKAGWLVAFFPKGWMACGLFSQRLDGLWPFFQRLGGLLPFFPKAGWLVAFFSKAVDFLATSFAEATKTCELELRDTSHKASPSAPGLLPWSSPPVHTVP